MEPPAASSYRQKAEAMTPFPLLISIPHGGTAIPNELTGHISIGKKDLFDDMDPFTREIYEPGDRAVGIVAADIARAFIDLNRSPDDLPPANPDGIVKSMTCYKKAIYIKGKEPGESMGRILIDKYYLPYHRKIKEIIETGEVHLALDCHSMAASPPPIAPDRVRDRQKKRPLICLGNVHGKACPPEMAERLADCFREAFLLEKEDVSVNEPFAGGYITRTYGNNPVPWVQVEMNRLLYLSSPWFDPVALTVDNRRLTQLNNRFKEVLECYFKKSNISWSKRR